MCENLKGAIVVVWYLVGQATEVLVLVGHFVSGKVEFGIGLYKWYGVCVVKM